MANEKMRLFQYAVLLHTVEVKDGKEVFTGAEIVIPLTSEVARSERDLMFKIIRLIPEDKTASPEHVEIIIKGF